MKKSIGKLVIKILGWKINENVPKELFKKCVVIAAPHTSNWDYPLAVYSMTGLGINIKYTIKKQWMKSPFGWFFKMMGGLGSTGRLKKRGKSGSNSSTPLQFYLKNKNS